MISPIRWSNAWDTAETAGTEKTVIVRHDILTAETVSNQTGSVLPWQANFTVTLKKLITSNQFCLLRRLYWKQVSLTHTFKKPCLANPKVRHCTVAELILIFQAETKPVFNYRYSVFKKSVSDGDFQQTKGIRSEQVINTGKIYGFRKFDKVRYLGNEYFIKGRMSTGYAVLMDINGKKADFSKMPKGFKTPKLSICRSISARKSQLIQAMAI